MKASSFELDSEINKEDKRPLLVLLEELFKDVYIRHSKFVFKGIHMLCLVVGFPLQAHQICQVILPP